MNFAKSPSVRHNAFMKRIAIFGAILISVLIFRQTLFTGQEDIILNQLIEIQNILQVEKKLTPVAAFAQAQKIKGFITDDFQLIYKENGKTLTVSGEQSVLQKLAQVFIVVHYFESEIINTQIKLLEQQAQMELEMRGKFKIGTQDYSEVRRFDIHWQLTSNSWNIQKVSKIIESYEMN